jgi:hypothetical protein
MQLAAAANPVGNTAALQATAFTTTSYWPAGCGAGAAELLDELMAEEFLESFGSAYMDAANGAAAAGYNQHSQQQQQQQQHQHHSLAVWLLPQEVLSSDDMGVSDLGLTACQASSETTAAEAQVMGAAAGSAAAAGAQAAASVVRRVPSAAAHVAGAVAQFALGTPVPAAGAALAVGTAAAGAASPGSRGSAGAASRVRTRRKGKHARWQQQQQQPSSLAPLGTSPGSSHRSIEGEAASGSGGKRKQRRQLVVKERRREELVELKEQVSLAQSLNASQAWHLQGHQQQQQQQQWDSVRSVSAYCLCVQRVVQTLLSAQCGDLACHMHPSMRTSICAQA